MAALLLCAGPAVGQDRDEEAEPRGPEEPTPEAEGEVPLAGELGFGSPSTYVFRGIPIEDTGFIAQPWTELDLRLMCLDGFVREIHVIGGLRMSIHTERTAARNAPEPWYELDFDAGVSVRLPRNGWIAFTYQGRNSPSDAFDMAHELHLRGRLDLETEDRRLWLQPQARLVGTLGPADGRNLYLEAGAEAGWSFLDGELASMDLFVPVAVGATLAGTEALGDLSGAQYRFTRFGAGTSIAFPGPLKPWEAWLMVEAWALGSAFRDALGHDRSVEVLVSGGLAWTFGQEWTPNPSRIPTPR
ncbi:MAG: hypothetical protein ACQEXJ_12380 [Myxococcota bacterium]